MSKIAKVFLALTAFGPVLLTYAAVSAMNREYWHAAWFVTSCILFVLVCAGLLRFARTRLQSRKYRTATVETADNEVFGLLLVYVLPLITRDLAAYNWYVWILATFLFCLVVAASYGHHFNPLLMFMRPRGELLDVVWKFYPAYKRWRDQTRGSAHGGAAVRTATSLGGR